MGDTAKMPKVDQEDDPSNFLDEDSSLVESLGSYKDTSKEHEQSYGVFDSSLDTHSCEQPVDPMRDIQGDGSPVMIQH